MTNAEINRRLGTMSPADIVQVKDMISAGYGARGIHLQTPFSMKQVNAVFELNERAR